MRWKEPSSARSSELNNVLSTMPVWFRVLCIQDLVYANLSISVVLHDWQFAMPWMPCSIHILIMHHTCYMFFLSSDCSSFWYFSRLVWWMSNPYQKEYTLHEESNIWFKILNSITIFFPISKLKYWKVILDIISIFLFIKKNIGNFSISQIYWKYYLNISGQHIEKINSYRIQYFKPRYWILHAVTVSGFSNQQIAKYID